MIAFYLSRLAALLSVLSIISAFGALWGAGPGLPAAAVLAAACIVAIFAMAWSEVA